MTHLASVVSRRLKLTKKGRLWWGLCPFHPDKNPSFAVYPDHYHCFACQAHGDVIDWLRRIEKLSFSEAKKWLEDGGGSLRALPKTRVKSEPVKTERADWPSPGIEWQELAFLRERLVQSHWSSDLVMFKIACSAPVLGDAEIRSYHPHAQPYVLERLRRIYPKK